MSWTPDPTKIETPRQAGLWLVEAHHKDLRDVLRARIELLRAAFGDEWVIDAIMNHSVPMGGYPYSAALALGLHREVLYRYNYTNQGVFFVKTEEEKRRRLQEVLEEQWLGRAG